MTVAENMELIRLLKLKEQELTADASKSTVIRDFVGRYIGMTKELCEFLKMFEENKN